MTRQLSRLITVISRRLDALTEKFKAAFAATIHVQVLLLRLAMDYSCVPDRRGACGPVFRDKKMRQRARVRAGIGTLKVQHVTPTALLIRVPTLGNGVLTFVDALSTHPS